MKSIFILLNIVITVCACGGGGDSSNSSETSYTTAEEYIRTQGFVGSILVKKEGITLLERGFGYSNKAQTIENGVDTRYRIGSLTKAFTAMAIVQLKNNNLITSYDDTIDRYLPDYPDGDTISLRHLLTHRSGIPEYLSLVDAGVTYTPEELIELFEGAPLDAEPGEQFNYSNSNYTLLGYLIEQLSGMSYENYLHTALFSVLGITNTEYGNSNITGVNYALGYRNTNQNQTASFIDMSIPFSAGALSSTLSDLTVWAESFSANILSSAEDNEEIFSEGEYGFGWVVTTISGKRAYTHSGSINGFNAIISLFPEENGLIIALSNADGTKAALNRIVNVVAANEF